MADLRTLTDAIVIAATTAPPGYDSDGDCQLWSGQPLLDAVENLIRHYAAAGWSPDAASGDQLQQPIESAPD